LGRIFSLTYPTAAVLLAIKRGHQYGFDIMDATGLPDGTVYPLLRRLERRGVLEAAWEDEEEAQADGRPQRRYYRLTALGEYSLEEIGARFPTLARLFEPA
jgi:DNA-binding PadR family transcriptional regulator